MTALKSQQPLKLSTIPWEIRAIILDYVFDRGIILFDDPCYRLTSRSWSLALLRTSKQLYSEGLAALLRAFRRTAIKYRNCMPIRDTQQHDHPLHYNFIRKYGKLFESMEILRLPYGQLSLALFPRIKRLTVGHFTHQIWSLYLPRMVFHRFPDILDKGILEAWDAVCERIRRKERRQPVETFVLDILDGIGRETEKRGLKVFVKLVVEAQTTGVSSMSRTIRVDEADMSDRML